MIKALLLSALLVASPMMENEAQETEVVFVSSTYTSEDGATLILDTETECSLTKAEETIKGVYTINENIITCVFGDKVYAYEINGTTIKLVEEQKEVNVIWEDFKAWASDWLEPTTLTTIISTITTIGSVITLVVKLLRLAKEKQLTVEAVRDELNAQIGDKIDSSLKNELDTYIPTLVKTINNQKEIIATLCKVVALAQSNDSSSKVAIMQLISSIGVDTDSVKKTIEEEEKRKQEKIASDNEKLEKIIENEK